MGRLCFAAARVAAAVFPVVLVFIAADLVVEDLVAEDFGEEDFLTEGLSVAA